MTNETTKATEPPKGSAMHHGRPIPEGFAPDFTCPKCGSHDHTYNAAGTHLVCLGLSIHDKKTGKALRDETGALERDACDYTLALGGVVSAATRIAEIRAERAKQAKEKGEGDAGT